MGELEAEALDLLIGDIHQQQLDHERRLAELETEVIDRLARIDEKLGQLMAELSRSLR